MGFDNYWNTVFVLNAQVVVPKISPITDLICLPLLYSDSPALGYCGNKHDVLETRMHFYVVLSLT